MFDKSKALENAHKKLQRQQEALRFTLAELEVISRQKPGASALISTFRVKRDRQALAIKATEELIELYTLEEPLPLFPSPDDVPDTSEPRPWPKGMDPLDFSTREGTKTTQAKTRKR